MSVVFFLLAESVFNAGLFIFFLLYNLYLLDLGFNESFVGLAAALLTIGSICGTLPAGWFIARFGVKAGLRVTFAASAGICALQAAAADRLALLGLSFFGGLAAAFRAVSIAPAVAQLSTEENRSRVFSWFYALGIGVGVFGGLLGGKLPDWIGGPSAKQTSLWIGCSVSAAAFLPTFWMRFRGAGGPAGKSIYPRTPFVVRYLAAAAVWNLFSGAFPPFFNVYFSRRLEAGTAAIGAAYSASQLIQAAGVLAAPLLFARLGLVPGIAVTQAAAAALLALLAPRWSLPAAAAVYAAFSAFQWMTQPGWQTLLMNGVRPEEQSGASALNFLVTFGAQAVAAGLFGAGLAGLGYPATMLITAGIGLCSAAVFRGLLGGQDRTAATSAARQ